MPMIFCMFQKRKKEFPPGTFIDKPARVMSILQLCLAFTILLWHVSHPFMQELFSLKSKMLIYQNTLDQKELFSALDEPAQKKVLTDYSALQETLSTPFTKKIKQSFRHLFLEIPPFEIAWLLGSVVIPILLLKKIEGATHVVWLLPLLALTYSIDNRLNGYPHFVTAEEKLFPQEELLVQTYVKEPLNRLNLQKAWELYLIDNWTKELPSHDENHFSKQLEKGQFAFNIARIKAREPLEKKPGFPQEPLFILALYIFWNLYFALVSSKSLIAKNI